MFVAGAIGFVWTSVDAARSEREIAYQQSKERCAGASNSECLQLSTAIRSAVADERAADFAAQQLWLNILGLLGLGATVLFAAFAWREAQRSADAAHDTLTDARNDAAEQATRFEAQLRIARDNLKIAQRAAAEVDRAWLRVDVTPISGLRIDEETVSIEARVIIENVGKGPAIGVESTGDLTFNIGELNRTIRDNAGLRVLSGRFGDIMFPGKHDVWEGRVSTSRKDFEGAIAADRASGDPMGVYPTIAMGVRYCLPGDDARRMTYIYLTLAKKAGAQMSFNDGDTSYKLADLTWRSDLLTGPVT